MKKYLFEFVAASMVFMEPLKGEEVYVTKVSEIFTNLPDDYRVWTKSTFQKKNIPVFLAVAGSTAILIAYDRELWEFFKNDYSPQNAFYKTFSDVGVFTGDGIFQFSVAAGFLTGGLLTDSSKALRTSAQIVEAILATGITVQLIKHVTGRESPAYSTDRTGVWRFFPNQIDYHREVPKYDAMPSGHLATATTTLVVIMDNYPDEEWIPYVGIPFLGCIAIGLVATGQHWWSDYPLGLALGYSFAKAVTAKNQTDSASVSLAPSFGPNFEPLVGLRAAW